MRLNLPYFGPVTVELPYLAGGLVGTLVVLGGIGYWFWGTGPTSIAGAPCTPKDTFSIADDEFTRGDPKAPITIVEYASMTCPHCARFNNTVLPHLEDDYVDKGYVRYVFREFPLDTVAMTISVIGRCLPHDQYLPFVARMYQTQEEWGSSTTGEQLRDAIKELAHQAGLSSTQFEDCLTKAQPSVEAISEIQQTAVGDYCVSGTPAMFMNGKVLAQGEISYKELDKKVRDELTRLGKTPPPPSAAALREEKPEATETPPAEGAATPPDGGTAPADGTAPATPPSGEAPPAPPSEQPSGTPATPQ
ncbi:MAG: thioredoxin domain-containing protein [Alphaproteobacteria bacterium]|nr:thioredoxin domain-containing protein [Alphaproteobacteria bacterium]